MRMRCYVNILWRMADRGLGRVLPPRQLAAYAAIRAWYIGEPELRLAKFLCDRRSISIDVGAAEGTYTYFLRNYSKACYSFEPNPDFAARLTRVFGRGVIVEACAVSDQTGTATLTIPVVDGVAYAGWGTIEPGRLFEGHVTRTVSVQTRRLDEFDFKGVGFIKIDVEGHEMPVLRGAMALLDRESPSFLIEAEERHKPGTVQKVSAFLGQRGYRGFFLLDRKLHPIQAFDPEVHQKVENGRKLLSKVVSRVYINNFLFLKDPAVIDRMSKLFAYRDTA